MTNANSTRSSTDDALKANSLRPDLTKHHEAVNAALLALIHPDTLQGLNSAARITKVSLLDFLIDSAWDNARRILDRQNGPYCQG
jgi:Arc/MetJ family transcription regulator